MRSATRPTPWTGWSRPATPAPGCDTAPRSSSATTPAADWCATGVRGARCSIAPPLEYEDEIAIIEHVKTLSYVDPDRVGLVDMSHGGEMVLKITSEYHGARCAVASEPAAHEYLALVPDETAFVNEATGLRNIEDMRMAETDKVRRRIDRSIADPRIAGIATPILVMGREDDHLQGIFRVTYELLREAGKDVEWVSYDHPLHGYIYPVRGPDGDYAVDEVQNEAIATVIGYLDRHLMP